MPTKQQSLRFLWWIAALPRGPLQKVDSPAYRLRLSLDQEMSVPHSRPPPIWLGTTRQTTNRNPRCSPASSRHRVIGLFGSFRVFTRNRASSFYDFLEKLDMERGEIGRCARISRARITKDIEKRDGKAKDTKITGSLSFLGRAA
jgi:hypothetical protein